MVDKDCFSKFFIEGEWDWLTTHQKLVAKLMFVDYLARRSKARDDEEVEKPAYLVRYDKRRAQLMEARRRELAQQAGQQNKGKPKAKSDNDDGLLRGFTELEISELLNSNETQ